jgi:uncharacterized protein
MLVFDVRSLATNAARVDGALPPDDAIWMPEDARPDGPIRVTGRLSAAGQGRFYFSGRIEGSGTLECRRCLTPVAVAVGEAATAIYTEVDNEDAGDPDVFGLAQGGKAVDLRPAVREQWLLNVPSFPLCRPDCRGFCPTCGADWNAGTCEHDSAARPDSPLTRRTRAKRVH